MNNTNATTLNNNNTNTKGKKSYFFNDPKVTASYASDHIRNNE